jgi:hypothetical protein
MGIEKSIEYDVFCGYDRKNFQSMSSPKDAPLGDRFDPNNPKAQALYQSMSDAYEVFQKAHAAYEHALSVTGAAPNPTDIIALQQAGRDYARAVGRHSQVVMAWLAMVDMSR